MRLDEIKTIIQQSNADGWHVLPTDAATYVHRFSYGSDARGDGIWGLQEHHTRAVLRENIDIGLVWGLDLEPGADLQPDWAEPLSAVNKKVGCNLAEVLYRGQPVDRIQYALVDNYHGVVPWPTAHYRPGANQSPDTIEPPESLTVTAWEMAVVSLTDALSGGGAFGAPEQYAKRAGITVQ